MSYANRAPTEKREQGLLNSLKVPPPINNLANEQAASVANPLQETARVLASLAVSPRIATQNTCNQIQNFVEQLSLSFRKGSNTSTAQAEELLKSITKLIEPMSNVLKNLPTTYDTQAAFEDFSKKLGGLKDKINDLHQLERSEASPFNLAHSLKLSSRRTDCNLASNTLASAFSEFRRNLGV